MRVALILNPRSGSIGDADAFVAAVRARTTALTVHDPGEGAAAAAERPDRILVAGGDGTIGDAFAAATQAGIPLAVIPAGTANDFARALHLPNDRDEALELALDPAARLDDVWGGTIGGRPFVNVASVGLAVDAAERAERRKRRLGPVAYAVGAVEAGLTGRAVDARVVIDGEQRATGAAFQLLVGASGRFGGGAGLGEADPTSPHLVTAWVPGRSRLELPLRAVGLRNRTLEQQPGIEWWHGCSVEVAARIGDATADWNVDGEIWQPPAKTVTLELLGPAQVVVPAAPTSD